MIFKYDVLSKIILEDKKVEINDGSYIKKIPGLNGVEYVSTKNDYRDYFVFIEVDDQQIAILSADNHTELGFELLLAPKSEYFVGVNTNNNSLDYYDGPGSQNDFPDVIESDDLPQIYHDYHAASDDELKTTKLYKNVDTCVSKYLQIRPELESTINVLMIRLSILIQKAREIKKSETK